jgi:hypothetical protein
MTKAVDHRSNPRRPVSRGTAPHLPEFVRLSTADLDVGVVLGIEAATLAADLTAETGRTVTVREVDSDKVLHTVRPAARWLAA